MERASHKSFRPFLILWTGEWISSIGSGLTAFALGVYVYQMTGTATSVALVTLCAFLPSILLGPIGGVLADRFDRRLLMLMGDLFSAVGLIFILVAMLLGDPPLWQICAGVTFSSIFVSLLDPAYKATITDLLTEEQFAKASGLVQLAASSKYLLSPVIAGILLSIFDIKVVLLIDIFTFLVTLLTILAVKRTLGTTLQVKEPSSFVKELKEGWSILTSIKGVLSLTFILSIVTFYIGFLQTLFTPMLLPLTDSGTLGTVMSVSAIGMLVGSLIIGIFSMKSDYIQLLGIGLGVAGWFYAAVGLTTNIYFIAGAAFLFFAAIPFINTSADVMIRSNIPNEAQGRAWGIIGILSQLGYVAAYALAGVLADRIFNPMLREGGFLVTTVGRVIGIGEGRGIGLLFIVCGLLIVVLAFLIPSIKSITSLEKP
ncbi:macrolide transporter [Bacillus sp. FJAT-27264]|uniref:MFS transporter n=1 Tax=Paenibacillus sp. (strain DSM 101736 / FJAT-27264) TaxID=1850362 RepID=UPI000807AFB3|nr:MFS transporter [Bacillus sp. FJAT-27264]OBZ18558.1 macrolide transporter [Bacillus sp. FJAT-27264]